MTASRALLTLGLVIVTALPLPAQEVSFGEKKFAYELSDVLPDAAEFVRRDGYWEGQGTDAAGATVTVGYVFLSDDLVEVPGYSGHTLNTLIGMDVEGTLTGVKVVRHSEPIVLIGLPESTIHVFTDQYVGKKVTDRVLISDRDQPGYTAVDGISGATVTAVAENATIFESARLVAKAEGLITAAEIRDRRPSQEYRPLGWTELVRRGAVASVRVPASELGLAGDAPAIDVSMALLDAPGVGRNLLGERFYDVVRAELDKRGGSALWIGGRGELSFKGPGFARGGIFDRFQVEQYGDLFVFKDMDYFHLEKIEIEGGPDFREGGVFFLDGTFDPTAPFVLRLTVPYRIQDRRTYTTYVVDYQLPDAFIEGAKPFWMTRWQQGLPAAIFLAVLLAGTAVAFTFRMKLLAHRKRVHLGVAVLAAVAIGLVFKAQPSTTQILTLTGTASRGRFPFEVFLSEPLLFLFWISVVLTLFVWGRGFFCGWVCPYGALLEALIQLWEKVAPKRVRELFERWEPPKVLRFGKYVTFLVILAISFFSLPLAEAIGEVEPFKTFVLRLARPGPFVAYFLIITAVSVVSHRFFCRFLCPLGGAIALPSQRPALRLLRYDVCKSCKICARGCEPRAISFETGEINYHECLQCWDCQATAKNADLCPALIRSAKEGRPPNVWTGALLLLLMLPVAARGATWTVTPAGPSLDQVLAEVSAGDTVVVEPGVYRANLVLRTSVTLRGREGAVLDGGGVGDIVAVDAAGATVEGLVLRGCNLDLEEANAAVKIAAVAADVTVRDNVMEACRFGVWVDGAPRPRIVANRIHGIEELGQNDRGDCIHLTDAKEALVEGNTLADCRDGVYMELNTGYRILGNEISDSRYAVHTMWCDGSVYDRNVAADNLVGLALMFSTRIAARDNILVNNSTHGILLVQVTRSEAVRNTVIGNTKGLFIYNSLYNAVRENLMAHNEMGLHYWGGSEENELSANAFVDNQIQVAFVAARDQTWRGNYWSDYQGWDMDEDGAGEVPYRSNTLIDGLLWKYPVAKLLLTSPALQLLALIEREMPVITVPKAVDEAPLMSPPMADWASRIARYPSHPKTYYGKLEKLPHVPGGKPL